ncbi:MAG: hypothetical protein JJE51_10785 [Thermoanaerobaculia bacterium]|nr:hypothetical protein [Thermoanaerobaculia bacterium]
MRSIRFFNRDRTTERGFVLVAALTMALLYFALMELLLLDSSRALGEAQRFRSRVVAATLAENAAELAALSMTTQLVTSSNLIDSQGRMQGKMTRTNDTFTIEGEGETSGVMPQMAKVKIDGRMGSDGIVKIDYTVHSQ